MSENDLVRRGDVLRLIEEHQTAGEGCDSPCVRLLAGQMIALPASPALPPDAAETLRQLRACASAWVPEAKLVGNVSAGDIVRALDAVIPPEPACTCVGMTVPWHDAPCPRAGIFTPGDAGAAFAKSAEPAPERCRCGGSGWVTEHLPERDAEVPCRRCGWGAEPAPSEKVPTISDEPCGGVNCANHRCPYMVSCTQGLCDKCGERVVPCPRCAPAPKCPEPGCHEGLLIPPANGRSPDDLPEPEACPRCAKGGGS